MCATAFNASLRRYLRKALHGDKDADEIARKVRESVDFINGLEPAMKRMVMECYGKSTQAAITVGIVILLGSAFNAWFIREKRLAK